MQTRIQGLIAENDKMKYKHERLKMEYDRLIRESVQFFTRRKRRRTSNHFLSVLEEEDEADRTDMATQPGAASTLLEPMIGHVEDENALQNMDIEIMDEVLYTPPTTPQWNTGENATNADTNTGIDCRE